MLMIRYDILLLALASIRAIDLTSSVNAIDPEPSLPLEIFISNDTQYGGTNSASNNSSDSATIDKPQENLTPSYETPTALQTSSNCFIGNYIQGIGFDTSGSIPPDSSGAAGAERLVAVVNSAIEVRGKDGLLIYRDRLSNFFAVVGTSQAGSKCFDPKVVYDEHAQRFVVISLQKDDTALSRLLVAVSKNERPDSVSDWNKFAINSALTIDGVQSWADYPGFEVDEEAVYITANMFSFSAGTFQAVRLWIVDKGVNGGIYSGGPATVFGAYNPYQIGGTATTTMPAQVHGSGGAGTSIGTYLLSSLFFVDGTVVVQIVTFRNPLGTATITYNEFSLGQISQARDNLDLPDSPQRGSAVLIETNEVRTLDAVWRNNKLWITLTINPRAPSINANQATAYWVRFDTTNEIITLEAHDSLGGETFSPQTSTFFPAVALNKQGQVAFGYSASSPTMYAGAHGSIFSGSTEFPFTVQSGLDYYIRDFGKPKNRWGDYSGISVDPVDDSFWIFNQFANVRGSPGDDGEDGRWGTAWARVYCTDEQV